HLELARALALHVVRPGVQDRCLDVENGALDGQVDGRDQRRRRAGRADQRRVAHAVAARLGRVDEPVGAGDGRGGGGVAGELELLLVALRERRRGRRLRAGQRDRDRAEARRRARDQLDGDGELVAGRDRGGVGGGADEEASGGGGDAA